MSALGKPLRATWLLMSVTWTVLTVSFAYLFARRVVTPPGGRVYDTRVLAVEYLDGSPVTVELPRNADTQLTGNYALVSSAHDSLIVLGEVLHTSRKTVRRRVLGVHGHDLRPGATMKFCGWQYLSPADLEVAWSDLVLGTPELPLPAWFLPSANDDLNDWVIHIHGRATFRAEVLRGAGVSRNMDLNTLVVSYRNDTEVPSAKPGRYALGYEEWRDVEFAMDFAAQHGAKRIVLYGWSMGAFISIQLMRSSKWRGLVAAAVFDSPALDWQDILTFQGRAARLPSASTRLGIWMLKSGFVRSGRRGGLPFTTTDAREVLGESGVPILLLHSEDDGYVPITPAEKIAQELPNVTLVRFRDARHVKLWNLHPENYETLVSSWLYEQLA